MLILYLELLFNWSKFVLAKDQLVYMNGRRWQNHSKASGTTNLTVTEIIQPHLLTIYLGSQF